MNEPNKRKPGRPKGTGKPLKAPDTHFKTLGITLPPEEITEIKSKPGGASRWVREMLKAERTPHERST